MSAVLVVAVALLAVPLAADQARQLRQAQPRAQANESRFRGMDRNNDGVISRAEWRGSAQSFRAHDWNGDGVLSGDEVRVGANRERTIEEEFAMAKSDDVLDDDREDRFEYLDANGNGRIERREWHGSDDAFEWLDRNKDNVLSRSEVVGTRTENIGVGTSGETIVVAPKDRWTDTGIDVRAGDTIRFEAQGTMQLSADSNDMASPAGSRTNRHAPEAPMRLESAGALIARIGESAPLFVGDRRTISRAPASGRLHLGVNDDHLGDNAGEYRVTITIERR